MIAAHQYHCTCPEEIRAQNHKAVTAEWWDDLAYHVVEDEFLHENPLCEYCGAPSQVAHHDNAGSYRSKEEYYKKENMTPACYSCHAMLRRGFVHCPECGGWMKPGKHETCSRCRGVSRKKARDKHPCRSHLRSGRCQKSRIYEQCTYAARNALRECEKARPLGAIPA